MVIHATAAPVTAAASGPGAQAARELARRGVRVAVLDRNGAGTKEVATDIDGIGTECDIASPDSVLNALTTAVVENLSLNGGVIRLDGALRLAPR